MISERWIYLIAGGVAVVVGLWLFYTFYQLGSMFGLPLYGL